ncbi:hypothetical protein [Falsiruegeria mediterranea]|uniref:DUF883 domain-containing protein n=1 Tax=Falsiruegeria mediterranea M17 TaxID=1200281 RepID=A0A2R8C901_9RHOB|nr:hypothetical protein [Falsiruegeria mediterranea]SPJ28868.1 hypothetical protein TRM7615_02377 [Falsiruegeria mediterranea M17]
MATKAQLEAELAELKSQLAASDAKPAPKPAPEPESEPEHGDEQSAFAALLKEHGVDTQDIDALWAQFSSELSDLPEKKPLLTAVAAFGLGFALGRMSKS